jgi:hypothetical protein
MMMMAFLMLLIFGFIHLSMLMATKYMVNYSAFAAARATMVGAGAAGRELAAFGVMDNLRWHDNVVLNTPIVTTGSKTIRGVNRDGVTSTYRVPFGLPIFAALPPGGLAVESFSAAGPDWSGVTEAGDNGE